LRPYKIAIADDHQFVRNAVKLFLEQDGIFTVMVIAQNGQELIDKLGSSVELDLILTDIKMPILDGIEATKLIREKGHTVSIVGLSCYYKQDMEKQFMESGGNLFLNKNIEPNELIENLINSIRMNKYGDGNKNNW